MSIQKKLESYNQSQLLTFYNDLNFKEKKILKFDFNKIDFKKMNLLYKNSYIDEEIDLSKISPIKIFEKEKIISEKDLYDIGLTTIKNGEYAVCIMAGGNGSRLGCKGPKGAYKLKINNKEYSIFELLIKQLKDFKEKHEVYVNLYVMTSQSNNDQTISFFEKNNYFGYPKEKIVFFSQDKLPIMNTDGKILLKDKCHVLFGGNGNGDVFASLKRNRIIKQMKKSNVKWVNFVTVDNILTVLIDPLFLGLTIKEKYKLASKSLFKEDPYKKEFVFCKYNNHPYLLDYTYINDEITFKQDENNNYLYRDTNMVGHLINIDLIEKFSNIDLPYNRAYRKNNYINEKGEFVIADSPNTFKFEKFIFNAFYYADDMLLLRVDKSKEFAPIKSLDGPYNPENAVKMYLENIELSKK